MTRRCTDCGRFIPTDGPSLCHSCCQAHLEEASIALIEREQDVRPGVYLLADTQGDAITETQDTLLVRWVRDPLFWLALLVVLAAGMAAWAWVPVWLHR